MLAKAHFPTLPIISAQGIKGRERDELNGPKTEYKRYNGMQIRISATQQFDPFTH